MSSYISNYTVIRGERTGTRVKNILGRKASCGRYDDAVNAHHIEGKEWRLGLRIMTLVMRKWDLFLTNPVSTDTQIEIPIRNTVVCSGLFLSFTVYLLYLCTLHLYSSSGVVISEWTPSYGNRQIHKCDVQPQTEGNIWRPRSKIPVSARKLCPSCSEFSAPTTCEQIWGILPIGLVVWQYS